MDAHEKRDSGRFQWNRGGWFGGQVGATLWLILLGGLLVATDRVGGWAVLSLGLLPNVVGCLMWRRRQRLSPYRALQELIALAGLCALVSMLILMRSDVSLPSLQLPSSLWFLLIYPGMMLVFHVQERAARRAVSSGQ